MAKKPCNFPYALDDLSVDREPFTPIPSDAFDIIESAIMALEQKVGVNGSTDPNSLEYRITAHIAPPDSLPHITTDPVTGKTYRWGIACQNGQWGILYEEVT